MSRQKLLAIVASLAVLVAAACTDLTAPRNDCPISGGSDTCGPH